MRRLFKPLQSLNWRYLLMELVLIVFGILIAVNIDSWNEDRKMQEQTQISIERIVGEMQANIEEIQDVIDGNREIFDFHTTLDAWNTNEINVVQMSPDTLQRLAATYGDYFVVQDSTPVDAATQEYRLGFSLSLEFGELSDLAWQTAKLSNTISQFDYSCLQDILSVYSFQEIFTGVQSKFLDTAIQLDEEQFILNFMFCHRLAIDLLARYQDLEESVKECL